MHADREDAATREGMLPGLVVRQGFFDKNESFAGLSAPFRDDHQRDAVLAGYEKLHLGNLDVSMQMSIYRRRPPG